MTRLMGRFCRDASPEIFVAKVCPAKMPESKRMVVPEFSASSARQLLLSPCNPRPVTRTVLSSTFTSAPNAFMQFKVLWQSAAAAKWRNSLVPSARAAIIAYRWEMDLSPGGSTPPESVLAGRMVRFFTLEF